MNLKDSAETSELACTPAEPGAQGEFPAGPSLPAYGPGPVPEDDAESWLAATLRLGADERACFVRGWGEPLVTDATAPGAARRFERRAAGAPGTAGPVDTNTTLLGGLHFFPLAPGNVGNRAGLLCVNQRHDPETVPADAGLRNAAHGIAIFEVCREPRTRRWQVVQSRFSRRVGAHAPITLSGPVRGSTWVRSAFCPAGERVRGTLGNDACGSTPWGTFLSGETHWARDLVDDATAPPRGLGRYGVPPRPRIAAVAASEAPSEASGADRGDAGRAPTPHPAYGWLVEIDPFAPNAEPVKRTALGRLAHGGIGFARAVAGRPIVAYLAEDSDGEYFYKFVSRASWDPARSDGRLLDDGVLHVARFEADGRGTWQPLAHNDPGFAAAASARGLHFADQADVLVHTRLAADAVAATRLARPTQVGVGSDGEVTLCFADGGRLLRESGGRPESDQFTWTPQPIATGETPSAGPRVTVGGHAAVPSGRTLFATLRRSHAAPDMASRVDARSALVAITLP